jgi:hypothetical protein
MLGGSATKAGGMVRGFASVASGAMASFAASARSAASAAYSAISGAVSQMQARVSSARLHISGISVGPLPHFSIVGDFNAKTKSVPHISVSYYATGGFTDGPIAIAGEKATEAVISFDPRYRTQNLGYWMQAGKMLGVAGFATGGFTDGLADSLTSGTSALSFAASTSSSTSVSFDFGGVTFAPVVSTGEGERADVMSQLRAAEEDFFDMLEEWVAERTADYGLVL